MKFDRLATRSSGQGPRLGHQIVGFVALRQVKLLSQLLAIPIERNNEQVDRLSGRLARL